ncbi:hypothetical protein [Marinomonas sp. THO17]|uniref:hypothetical protein n=1 Tax=Marinomonas sp. THO17 TaxID=3149048 RepID=UPI00336BFC2C
MSKWLIWTILEITTVLLVANLVFIWLNKSVKNKIAQADSEEQTLDSKITETNDTNSKDTPSEDLSYKAFAQFLDKQISHAAASINPDAMEPNQITTLKIWGTVLQAERAIVLNQVSNKPKPILARFLSSLLYALTTPKLQTSDPEELHKNLKQMEEEFYQTSESLITKETLSKNQHKLNEDLRKSIDNAAAKLQKLNVKRNEQQRLQKEADALKKRIERLEELQDDAVEHTSNISTKLNQNERQKEPNRTSSYKQIMSLNSLADRQKLVIEQLRSELEYAKQHQASDKTLESQKVAVAKLERMSEESNSLVLQLENELQNSDLSIEALRQNISDKDQRLAEMEQQLSNKNQTAVGNLQSLAGSKKETLGSLIDDLSDAMAADNNSENLMQQEKDTQALERLLQESETCVTLLAQELEMAEEKNNELKQQVDAIILQNPDFGSQSIPLKQEKERNRKLVQATAQLKEQLNTHISENDYQELRVSFNKKSLEYDRLQLAYSDLEMKYLATLNK